MALPVFAAMTYDQQVQDCATLLQPIIDNPLTPDYQSIVDDYLMCRDAIVLVPGCMDATAINYNINANQDDGSCEYPINTLQFASYEQLNPIAHAWPGTLEEFDTAMEDACHSGAFTSPNYSGTIYQTYYSSDLSDVQNVKMRCAYMQIYEHNGTSYHSFKTAWQLGGTQYPWLGSCHLDWNAQAVACSSQLLFTAFFDAGHSTYTVMLPGEPVINPYCDPNSPQYDPYYQCEGI